jgi:hypothetical protein
MKTVPLTPGTEALARRLAWFEEPAQALSDTIRFVGRHEYFAWFHDQRRFSRVERQGNAGDRRCPLMGLLDGWPIHASAAAMTGTPAIGSIP